MLKNILTLLFQKQSLTQTEVMPNETLLSFSHRLTLTQTLRQHNTQTPSCLAPTWVPIPLSGGGALPPLQVTDAPKTLPR